jgi:hypothetical protein
MFKGEVGKDCQNCDPGQYRTTNDVDSQDSIVRRTTYTARRVSLAPLVSRSSKLGKHPAFHACQESIRTKPSKLHAFHVHATRKVLNHTRQIAILVKKVKSLKKEVLNV